jgi:hypothetical protein
MLLGPVLKNPPPPIVFGTGTVDRVASFKLLGVPITNNLSWEEHGSVISTRASKRIHFFQTAETFVNDYSDDLLLYYKSVIRPVLECACPVWQSDLTADQLDRLESIQYLVFKQLYRFF